MNLLFGIARGLSKKQYAIQLVTDRSQIEDSSFDGYLITGTRSTDYSLFDNLKKTFILFGENHRGYDFVDKNNKVGGEIATQYALSRLYRNIIFIGINVQESFEFSRETGYVNTLQKNKMIPQIFRIPNHSHATQKIIEENFKKFKKDTCFICASDRIATGIVRQLLNAGARVPEDFGVIGYDGVFLDQISNLKLTTIKQPIFEMGELLAKMLLQKIDQNGSPQGEAMLKPTLV